MNLIPRDQVIWRTRKIIKESTEGPESEHPYLYELELPHPLSEWDVFDYWEKERFASMRANLKKGMKLFDIGTEQGWCNLIYAQFVGPENMVLIEPTPEFWPNIEATWHRNVEKEPLAFYDGLFSDKTTDTRTEGKDFLAWPTVADGPLIDRNSYKYIHEHGDVVPQITIDEYVRRTGIVPDALTMDTEGSELLILRGAVDTLTTYKPLVWVSIHPELGLKDYGISKEDTITWMTDHGYEGEHLATDHEEHWIFRPGND